MSDGYDPRDGRIMVPFDLRRDVLEPLRTVAAKLEDLAGSVRHHLDGHEDRLEAALERWHDHRREARRRWLITWAKRVGAAIGTLLIPLLGILFGRSG
ncbi:MAG TPA: hypothetical protein VNO79_17710 [Actinomycetota bacterium]|nr:hypothetical protein [Actinomycetota bacterium]HXF74423.1 hypothetical protein [Actinomycetota bacterium]